MALEDICALAVAGLLAEPAHCYLWISNVLLEDGLRVRRGPRFTYKTMLVWHKVRADGGSDGSGWASTSATVTEPVLFGPPGPPTHARPRRRQVNLLASRKREHSRKPDELYDVVKACSPGPYLELCARYARPGRVAWGDEADSRRPREARTRGATSRWGSSVGSMLRKLARINKF